MSEPFHTLISVLAERRENPIPSSYTSQLMAQGEDEIIKKVGEEAIEIILAAKSQGDDRLLEELADFIYHVSVLLVARGHDWSGVECVLADRAK